MSLTPLLLRLLRLLRLLHLLLSSFVSSSLPIPMHRFQSMARLKQLKGRIPILAELGELSPL